MKISRYNKSSIKVVYYLIVIIGVVFFTYLFSSCKSPIETDELIPGRRDYTWKVDTLKAFNTYLMKMWGSSPTNIWAVGHGCCFEENIWHYDGKEWSTDGVWRGIEPWCIYGFAENDIWIGGSEGEIWHYDGITWSENLRYQNPNYKAVYFMDIWGEKPNDVYAVGFADSSDVGLGDITLGIMMHYNGTEWSRVNIEFTEGMFRAIRKGNKTSNNYYLWNHIQRKSATGDSAKYFEFDRKNLNEIYYDRESPHNITVLNDEVVFSYNDAIYSYSNNIFNQIVQNPFPNAWNTVYGRDRKDIIWMMSDGLTHYNGTDFEYILNFENKSLSDGFVFKDEVFFVANDFYNNNANNLVYHGVLK